MRRHTAEGGIGQSNSHTLEQDGEIQRWREKKESRSTYEGQSDRRRGMEDTKDQMKTVQQVILLRRRSLGKLRRRYQRGQATGELFFVLDSPESAAVISAKDTGELFFFVDRLESVVCVFCA
ncbi:hypothetical protein HPP92_025984 [Vanilla planifolia]|uniref:Uncharacterized protein n=1 Tax=Vanilla planifolia TaxID=51239 RepID=A0A835PGC8_VANPL|nr:hypothetical protein HPP92_025984 [Vanilla planifolia]